MRKFAYLQLIIIMLLAIVLPALPATAADGPNLFANPSAETLTANVPTDWLSNSWGTNTSTFSLINPGQSGNVGIRTNVTAYTDGDAKWYPTPVTVEPGKEYVISEFYRSGATSEVVIQYTLSNGSNSYAWQQTAPVVSTWTKLTRTVVIPANVTKMTVFHVLNKVGWLEVDNFSLSVSVPAPNPVCEDPLAANQGNPLPCTYPAPNPIPSGDNLIQNPSMETVNSQNTATPLGWASNSWGTNSATFQYLASGRTGSKSVKTTVTSYTSGDAKWYFTPTAVTPGQTYDYSHYYKSTAFSEVVLQYTNSNGTATYAYVGGFPASSNWTEMKASIVVPSGVAKVTVFHVLATVGELILDDAFLSVVTPEPPSSNPIPNSSLENASGNFPTQWTNNKWGTNNASFTTVNDAHSGSKSVKTTITNYTSGDGKWYFNPVSLTQGQEYAFSVWYKTNTAPQVVAMFTDASGNVSYQGLPVPQPGASSATVWQEYKNTFSVPSNAVSTTVFMLINKVGWVQTDDYKISSYESQGFNRSLVTLTFDDGHEINTQTALPIMQSYGFASTQCYATTFIEDANNKQQAINSVLQFRDAGHEICSHTVTHPFLTQLSTTNATYELSHSQQYLQSITGQPILNFASPFGDYNSSVIDIIDNYYQSHRSVDTGYNSINNFDIYRLKVQNILSTTTTAELQSWLEHAKATNTWLILVYHRVENNPGTYDSYTADFAAQMQVLSNSGIAVKTYNAALQELVPQL